MDSSYQLGVYTKFQNPIQIDFFKHCRTTPQEPFLETLEKVLKLRAVAALAEAPDLVLSIHLVAHNYL